MFQCPPWQRCPIRCRHSGAFARLSATFRHSLLILLLVSAPSAPALAKEQTVEFDGEVAARDTYGVRLRNLPEGTSLTIDMNASGPLVMWLLDEANYGRFPDVERSLMRTGAVDRFDFSIRIPESGIYFLVLDNRNGNRSAEFDVRVHAALDRGDAPLATRLRDELDKLEAGLRKLLIFDPLGMRVEECGVESGGGPERICVASVQRLFEGTNDDDTAKAALQFLVLHRVGHILLRQWDFPFHANEDVADEMAAVLMVMFSAADAARLQARHFVAASDGAAGSTDGSASPHRLTAQRANTVLRLLDNPEFARRWQAVLVPHMQTAILELLRQRPQQWTDTALIDGELESRRKAE